MKILIAEDNAIATKVLRLTLEKLGHEVVAATTGLEAWERFDAGPVRVIVSDWMMPDMDGLDFCLKVRNRPQTPYTYFMLLTAAGMTVENYTRAMDAGVDDFLNKPLDAVVIRSRLRVAERILGYATQLRQLQELIPMCAYCSRVRDDADYWERVETFIQGQTGTRFSHGICPDCLDQQLAQIAAMPQFEAGQST